MKRPPLCRVAACAAFWMSLFLLPGVLAAENDEAPTSEKVVSEKPASEKSAGEAPLFAPLGDGGRLPTPPMLDTLPSPQRFLGYALGARFTPHAYLLAYLDALDLASERVTRIDYGKTNEGRPLRLYVISSPQNLAQLDDLRRNNLRLADPAGLPPKVLEELKRSQPALVWLAFGVHGNETSSSEAALAVAYTLAAAPPQSELAKGLDETVVLIDPLSNPDGRDRYVTFYHSVAGETPDPDPRSLEHREPWPSGRPNHYLIDLNRDWAWLSQVETQARVAAYRLWEPHVYVDFHEMGVEQTYFFPPAADPVHPLLEGSTLDWMEVFGRANAEAFDRHSWLFFIHEEYDFFYPGYGDTYPSLRGAIGMTYEAGGGGRAGLATTLKNGELKTLSDRVARHYTTALATLRTAMSRRRDLVRDFVARRAEKGAPRTYLWSPDQPEARHLAELLESHGIEVRQLEKGQQLRVMTPMPGGEVERSFRAGTLLASTEQPLGRLLRALFDAGPNLSEDLIAAQVDRVSKGLESELYDTTAWSLPLALNLEAWVHAGQLSGTRPRAPFEAGAPGEGGVGFLLPPQGLASYRALFRSDDLRWRFFTEAIEGDASSRGSLFLPRQGNPPDLEARVQALANELGLRFERMQSSWQDEGPSLGSARMVPLRHPRVALLAGAGVEVNSHGFLWHLFDQDLGSPLTRFDARHLAEDGDGALADIDVLILPDGNYGRQLDETLARRLEAWVRAGGTLIGIGGAIPTLHERGLSRIEQLKTATTLEDPLLPGGKSVELPMPQPGAIVATEWVGQHALSAGLPTPPPVHFEGADIFEPTGDPRVDVLVVRNQDPVLAGLIWPDAVETIAGSLLVAKENLGRGRVVVFAQDPYFRLFWQGTTPLFLNAVLGLD